MRWRRQVTAESLKDLEAAAERYFRPGTTYSIYSVREETPAGVFLSYRAEAHPPETPGKYSTSHRTPRRGGKGTEADQGTVGARRSGTSGPDDGPVTGRIIDPSASAPAGGRAPGVAGGVTDSGTGGAVGAAGAGMPGASPGGPGGGPAGRPGVRVPGGGAVTGYNPETVDELPGWRPEAIPARVLAGGPGLNAAYALLQDPELDLPAGPAFATDDPEFVALLDRAAPPEDGSTPDATPRDRDRSATGGSSVRPPMTDAPRSTGPASTGPDSTGPDSAGSAISGPLTGSLPTGSSATDSPLAAVEPPPDDRDAAVSAEAAPWPGAGALDRHAARGNARGGAAETPRRDVRPGEASAAVGNTTRQAGATGPDAEWPDGTDAEQPGRPRESGRPTVVYVGLLDDAVEAAEKCGHRRWSAAGVLNGGQPGANVVCYGLGDGSNVVRLAEGLPRYQPMRLVLAVDASRKHADTQAWVHQVARVVQPSSLVSVARTVTSSPGTVQELGYPVQYVG
ncbi:MAG: hypothetical protein QJR09_02890 [Micrococcus sp.]|nr:hypothetical protein [Micrococcus sp.]